MTLLELRRYAIRNRTRIRFTLASAGECVVNEHGLLKIPSLRTVPDFNVERELGSVGEFVLGEQVISREKLQALIGYAPQAGSGHEE